MKVILYHFLVTATYSVEGGSKNVQTAKQEVVDLSKFLYLVNPEECNVSNVTMMVNIVTYLNKLRKIGVGPSGQVTKLTTILNALKMIVSTMPDNGIDEVKKDLVVWAKVVETKKILSAPGGRGPES